MGPVQLSLMPMLQHLIVSFRPMPNVNLTLTIKDSATTTRIQLQTLVLPCLPVMSNAIDILDLDHLKILDIGFVNVRNRLELSQLDHLLAHRRCHSLVNLTLSLSEWQHARLTVRRTEQFSRQSAANDAPFDSIFANCFEPITIADEGDETIESVASNKVRIVPRLTEEEGSPVLCRHQRIPSTSSPSNSSTIRKHRPSVSHCLSHGYII